MAVAAQEKHLEDAGPTAGICGKECRTWGESNVGKADPSRLKPLVMTNIMGMCNGALKLRPFKENFSPAGSLFTAGLQPLRYCDHRARINLPQFEA